MRLVYVSRSDGVHDRRFVDAWTRAGVHVTALVAGPDDDTALAQALAEAAPDVVQVGPVTSPGATIARLWSGPLIATSWGFDLMDEISHDHEVARAAEAVLRRADLVFVDNAAVGKRAESLGADPNCIVNFPWGLSEEWFGAPTPQEHEGIVVLSTRRHEELYRVDDLIRAFVLAAPDVPELRLNLCGSGTLTAEFRWRVEEAGVAERVSFLGDLESAALRDAYLSADLYVSTSRVDGTSISLLEAMSSGLPVVVTSIPGNLQWVTSDTGWTFEVGDHEGLAQHLRNLGTVAELRNEARRRAVAARLRVLSDADWKATTRQLPDFARLAIDRHRRRREAS